MKEVEQVSNIRFWMQTGSVSERGPDSARVNFRVEAKKPGEDKIAFIVDLAYGALVMLKNVPKENHAPVVMVEVPKLLFPFAREIIANATSSGGFPPLYLTPISFEQIYVNEMKRQQEQRAVQKG